MALRVVSGLRSGKIASFLLMHYFFFVFFINLFETVKINNPV
jgi:hypothetical protein